MRVWFMIVPHHHTWCFSLSGGAMGAWVEEIADANGEHATQTQEAMDEHP